MSKKSNAKVETNANINQEIPMNDMNDPKNNVVIGEYQHPFYRYIVDNAQDIALSELDNPDDFTSLLIYVTPIPDELLEPEKMGVRMWEEGDRGKGGISKRRVLDSNSYWVIKNKSMPDFAMVRVVPHKIYVPDRKECEVEDENPVYVVRNMPTPGVFYKKGVYKPVKESIVDENNPFHMEMLDRLKAMELLIFG